MPHRFAIPSPNDSKVRLLIADDVARVLQDLRRLLQLTGGIEIVGEAQDGQAAVRLAEELHPDVVLMDLEMPVLDGWEATRRITQQGLAGRVVGLSVHADPDSVRRAREAGADALVPKGASLAELMSAITGRHDPAWPEEEEK